MQPFLAPFEFGEYVEFAGFLAEHPVFALADGQIRMFTDEGEQTLQAHDGLTCATIAHDAKSLITGGEDGKVLSTNAKGEYTELGAVERKWIDSVATGPNGVVAWSAGKEVTVKNGDGIHTFSHESTVEDIAFAPKGLRIAAARYNGVDLYWAGTEAEPQSLEWDGPHNLVRFSPDGRFLVTSMQENVLHGWRLDTGAHMRMAGYPTKVKSLDFTAFTSKGGKWLATSGANSAVLWPFTGQEGPMGKVPRELGTRPESVVTQVACHPKEAVVAIGYADGLVGLAAIEGETETVVRPAGKAAVTAFGWNETGTQLVFGTEDGAGGLVDMSN
ncbi:MAG: WD40 repeat domain-containing protein [Pseudomonadota bacterium]